MKTFLVKQKYRLPYSSKVWVSRLQISANTHSAMRDIAFDRLTRMLRDAGVLSNTDYPDICEFSFNRIN